MKIVLVLLLCAVCTLSSGFVAYLFGRNQAWGEIARWLPECAKPTDANPTPVWRGPCYASGNGEVSYIRTEPNAWLPIPPRRTQP